MGGIRLYLILVAAVILVGIAAMLPMAWTGADILQASYREYALRDMTANANLFGLTAAPIVAKQDAEELQRIIRLADSISYTRFTIIAPDGRVLADSEEDPARMENHGNRPEVAAALAGRTGTDIRKSPTLGNDWIYAAVPLAGGGVVRGAASLEDVDLRLSLWWRKALLGVGMSLVILLGLTFLIARRLARPLERAARTAGRFAAGNLEHRLPIRGSAEMRQFAASLNRMAEELGTRFKLITEQREEIGAVFTNMSEGVIAVDPDGRIILLNRAAETLLGVSEGAAGKVVESVIRQPELLDILREAESAAGTTEREIRLATDAAEDIQLQVHATSMREADGSRMGVLAVLRDVTRLRRLETIRKDFIANVSHELRTPITSIQSCLETLLDDGFDDRESAEEFLDIALRNTRRMGAIVGNLLLLAGMESGSEREHGEIVSGSVKAALDEAIAACAEAAAARRITVEAICPDDLQAMMNQRLVSLALVNLIDNAVKYGPEGGTVSVRAYAEGESVKIRVSDQGPGIPPKHQSRVFERFYRVDGPARIKEGSGLGLAIVKHIALSQGGDIKLQSNIGYGSSFILSLPVAK